MKKNKPKNVITIIHTGTGNNGTTHLGNKRVSKTDPVIEYIGLLDNCQSNTFCSFDYIAYNEIFDKVQNILFLLGGLANNPDKIEYKNKLELYYKIVNTYLDQILNEPEKLPPLEGFIKTTSKNYHLMQLRCKIRDAERTAVYLKDLVFIDDIHLRMLNILSDLIFALAWRISVETETLEIWTGQ